MLWINTQMGIGAMMGNEKDRVWPDVNLQAGISFPDFIISMNASAVADMYGGNFGAGAKAGGRLQLFLFNFDVNYVFEQILGKDSGTIGGVELQLGALTNLFGIRYFNVTNSSSDLLGGSDWSIGAYVDPLHVILALIIK